MPTTRGGEDPDRRSGPRWTAGTARRTTTLRAVAPLPARVRAFVESGPLAHCVTINRDGSPQVSAVWVALDGDDLLMAHLRESAKVRNLRRDPRVALSFESPERNAVGMQHNLVLHGTAEVTEGGAPELLQRMARVYVGPDAVFPGMPDPPPGFVARIRVDRVGGAGPWHDPE